MLLYYCLYVAQVSVKTQLLLLLSSYLFSLEKYVIYLQHNDKLVCSNKRKTDIADTYRLYVQ